MKNTDNTLTEGQKLKEKDKGLEKFISFLKDLTKSSQNGNKGEEFENLIEAKLQKSGALKTGFDKLKPVEYIVELFSINHDEYKKNFNTIKNKILNKNSSEIVSNPFKNINANNTYAYIKQPYGSQNFPDFLILTNKYVFPLEIKFSTKATKTGLPKWNSNIPKSNAIYVYANAEKQKPLIFLGDDFLGQETRILLNDFFEEFNEKEKIEQLLNNIKNNANSYNPFGLYPKIRTDFLYKDSFRIENKEKLNIFQFAEKMGWEKNVFYFLEGLLKNEE
ncbi:hypothetical protein [Mesomycoplasma ovipneumoniae]|uniref:hypothetical protein n=1 Tax=Mesomycoplasma ovipneumoniae TaxID=29562 RepID=UPI002FD2B3BA